MARWWPKGVINGEKYHVTLARLVLGLKEYGMVARHVNGDMLDCTRKNLKAVDREWMLQNSKTPNTNTSGHRGVSWDNTSGKWDTYLHHGGRKYSGGSYRRLEDAVMARRALESEYFRSGADAVGLNTPVLKTTEGRLSYPEQHKAQPPMATTKKKTDLWRAAISTLLEENLMTNWELAEKCGVSAQTVSNWLNNVRNPGVFAKRKIMKLIRETEYQRTKDGNLLGSLLPASNPDSEKEQLEEMLGGMTPEQIRKLLKAAEKMGKLSSRTPTPPPHPTRPRAKKKMWTNFASGIYNPAFVRAT